MVGGGVGYDCDWRGRYCCCHDVLCCVVVLMIAIADVDGDEVCLTKSTMVEMRVCCGAKGESEEMRVEEHRPDTSKGGANSPERRREETEDTPKEDKNRSAQ